MSETLFPSPPSSIKGGFVLRNVPLGSRTLTITAVGWKSYSTQLDLTKNATLDIGTIGLPSSLSR